MKKLMLLTAAVLVCGSSVVLAGTPGINLSWSNCATTAAFANKDYLCDGDFIPLGCQGTFRSALTIPNFALCTSVVEIAFAGPVPDYWKTHGDECDAGGMGLANPISTAPCASPNLFDANYSGGGMLVTYPQANRIRIQIDWATGAAVAPTVTAGLLYPAFRIALDPSQGVNRECAGCGDPACLVLKSVEVMQFLPGGDCCVTADYITGPDVRQYVTWQGGAIGGEGCPAATPARSKTWGAVKGMYR